MSSGAARMLLGGVAAVSAFFMTPAARAAERAFAPNVELHYAVANGIRGCLSEPEFDDAVWRRLADSSFSGTEAISVTTTIEESGERLRATVTLREGVDAHSQIDAQQEIFSAPGECATLGAAAALTASLTIQRSHERARAKPPADAPPPALPPPAREPPPRARARMAPPPREERRGRVALRTHVVVVGSHGVLPSTSGGTAFGASVKIDRWSAELELGASLPATITSRSGRGSGRAWRVFSSASACVHASPMFLCGVGILGAFRASGTGQLQSRAGDAAYVALGGRVGAEIVAANPFSLVVHGTVVAPLLRPSLRIGDELLWRAPAVGGEIGIGVRVSIP